MNGNVSVHVMRACLKSHVEILDNKRTCHVIIQRWFLEVLSVIDLGTLINNCERTERSNIFSKSIKQG